MNNNSGIDGQQISSEPPINFVQNQENSSEDVSTNDQYTTCSKHIRFHENGGIIEVKRLSESSRIAMQNKAGGESSKATFNIKYLQRQNWGKRKKLKRKNPFPPEMKNKPKHKKFWHRRLQLFSKFNEGIQLDKESWYSVTPEIIAKLSAKRCACDLLIDAFCGAGGNCIQFAFTCKRVIAIDIDPKKIELAKNNAMIYGVADKIDFIVGDFCQLANNLKADVVFLSPPWGGPSYSQKEIYDLETMLQPLPFSSLVQVASKITKNIAAYLPKNSSTGPLFAAASFLGDMEVKKEFIKGRQFAITAYYNDLAHKE